VTARSPLPDGEGPLALFIDTNVLLSFLKMRPEDLEELRKATLLVRRGRIVLFVPEQVTDEYRRNRAAAVQSALTIARERKRPEYPGMMREHPKFDELAALDSQALRLHSEILEKASQDANSFSLLADQVMGEVFDLARQIPFSAELLARARARSDRGNPPGKDKSLGDALIWESLLAAVPRETGLHFVAGDSDWSSPLGLDEFNEFLQTEWNEKNGGPLHYYRRLSLFFGTHFPDIRIAAEAERDLDILDLHESSSFSNTHACISALERHSSFSTAQANALVAAYIQNSQVYNILTDTDVWRLAQRLLKRSDLDTQLRSDLEFRCTAAVGDQTT
jgi:predicted nucleic acid-binding protein